MQIIIATHSPELLDHKCIEADNIRFVDWREGKTYVNTLSKASTQSLQDHLMSAGELMQAGELVSEEAEIAKI